MIKRVERSGAMVVAAGSNRVVGDTQVWPGASDGAITMGSTEIGSRFGDFTVRQPYIKYYLPGQDIWTANVTVSNNIATDKGSNQGIGTSFATSSMSAIAASWMGLVGGTQLDEFERAGINRADLFKYALSQSSKGRNVIPQDSRQERILSEQRSRGVGAEINVNSLVDFINDIPKNQKTMEDLNQEFKSARRNQLFGTVVGLMNEQIRRKNKKEGTNVSYIDFKSRFSNMCSSLVKKGGNCSSVPNSYSYNFLRGPSSLPLTINTMNNNELNKYALELQSKFKKEYDISIESLSVSQEKSLVDNIDFKNTPFAREFAWSQRDPTGKYRDLVNILGGDDDPIKLEKQIEVLDDFIKNNMKIKGGLDSYIDDIFDPFELSSFFEDNPKFEDILANCTDNLGCPMASILQAPSLASDIFIDGLIGNYQGDLVEPYTQSEIDNIQNEANRLLKDVVISRLTEVAHEGAFTDLFDASEQEISNVADNIEISYLADPKVLRENPEAKRLFRSFLEDEKTMQVIENQYFKTTNLSSQSYSSHTPIKASDFSEQHKNTGNDDFEKLRDSFIENIEIINRTVASGYGQTSQ